MGYELDKIAKEYDKNAPLSEYYLHKAFKAGVKESVNLINYKRIIKYLKRNEQIGYFCEERRVEDIVDLIRRQIEKQIKSL